MKKQSSDFLGTGWKFPIEFSLKTKTAVMLSGEEDIMNSLDVLFATKLGERVMQPEFGSELDEFVFENFTRSNITYLRAVISDAILFNEPRIIVTDIDIEQSILFPELIDIKVEYIVSATNNRYNYVYPFYLTEATNLDM